MKVTTGRAQTIWIPGWLPAPLVNGPHSHWSVYQKKLKAAQTMVCVHGRQASLQPITGRARATITLVFRVKRRRDLDGLYARCKGCVDGLVRGGWIADDHIGMLDLSVRATVAEAWGTRIELVPMPSVMPSVMPPSCAQASAQQIDAVKE